MDLTRVLVAYKGPPRNDSIPEKADGADGNNSAPLGEDGHIFHLPNPANGKPACYMILNGALQEITWFKQTRSSWFLDDSVLEDGSLYLGTPVDVLLHFLPVLETCRMRKRDEKGVFADLDCILSSAPHPNFTRLHPLIADGCLFEPVCETKQVAGASYYRLDDERVLAWLCCKVDVAIAALREHGGVTYASLSDAVLTNYAIGLLSEYIPGPAARGDNSWLSRLCAHYGIHPSDAVGCKLSSQPDDAALGGGMDVYNSGDNPPSKFAKKEMSGQSNGNGQHGGAGVGNGKAGSMDDAKGGTTAGAAAKGSAAAKLAKQAQGSRKITSFFAKPR
eukprot:jgi/Mesvir1/18665/Mv17164-RA.1